jgi:hypothetical protein
MIMQPLNDIVCAEGDGVNQVITHLRHWRARLRETADLDDLTQVQLHNRAMLLRNEADALWSWSLKLHEDYLFNRARKLIKAQGEIEFVQRGFCDLLDALRVYYDQGGSSETVDDLFRRLIGLVERWEALL